MAVRKSKVKKSSLIAVATDPEVFEDTLPDLFPPGPVKDKAFS